MTTLIKFSVFARSDSDAAISILNLCNIKKLKSNLDKSVVIYILSNCAMPIILRAFAMTCWNALTRESRKTRRFSS